MRTGKNIYIEFRDIEYVESIARKNSFTQAADELHITQPALSIYIRNLEKRLELPLFSRIGKKTVLTYTGQCFLEEGRQILKIRENLHRRLNDIRCNEEGFIRIGVTRTRGMFFLPLMLKEFQTRYPKAKIEFHELHAQQLEKLLLENLLDIAFLNQFHKNNMLLYHEITREPTVVFLSRDLAQELYPFTREGFPFPWIDLRKLSNIPFIHNFPEQGLEQLLPQIFQYFNIAPPIATRVRNQLTAINLASNGYGAHITVLYTICDVTKLFKTTILSFGDWPGQFDQKFFAVTAKNAHFSTLISEFIQLAREKYVLDSDKKKETKRTTTLSE